MRNYPAHLGHSMQAAGGVLAQTAVAVEGGAATAVVTSQAAPGLQRQTSALTEGSSGAEEGQTAGTGKGKAGRKFNPRNPGRTGKCPVMSTIQAKTMERRQAFC